MEWVFKVKWLSSSSSTRAVADFAKFHNSKSRPFQFLDPSLCWKILLASTGNPPKGARGALASPGIQKYANAPKLSERNSINRKRLSKCGAPKQNEARNAYASKRFYFTVNKIETINRCEKRNIQSILNIAKK